MSPLAVFFRTLSRSSAICIGIGLVIVNPPLDWSPGRALTDAAQLTGVTAQKSPNEAALDGLIAALKDSDDGVRRQAAIALGQTRDRAAVEALITAVRDSNVDVRRRAIMALGEIRDANAIPALTTALKDDDAGVRRAAVLALAELGGGERPDSHLDHHSHPNPHSNPNPNPNPNPRPDPLPRFEEGR